jgi:hypothetical protein
MLNNNYYKNKDKQCKKGAVPGIYTWEKDNIRLIKKVNIPNAWNDR